MHRDNIEIVNVVRRVAGPVARGTGAASFSGTAELLEDSEFGVTPPAGFGQQTRQLRRALTVSGQHDCATPPSADSRCRDGQHQLITSVS